MSSPFVAEIRMWGCNFAPQGWAFCNGQILPISQNTALFSLLGTYYGGDGRSNFALPNLMGSAPMFWGQGPGLSQYNQGESGGQESVTLLESEIPAHSHTWQVQTRPATENAPDSSSALARSTNGNLYTTAAAAGPPVPMAPQAVSVTGGSLPHNNMMPYLTLNFCIALQGVYPPRS